MRKVVLGMVLVLLAAGCRTDRPARQEGLGDVLRPQGRMGIDEQVLGIFEASFGRQERIETDEQVIAISEAVLVHMFTDRTHWDRKISRRFVSIQGQCPALLVERLRVRTDMRVLSPFVESPEDYPNGQFIDGRYLPKADESLFYIISGISREGDGTVRVLCSVVWHSLAARGYEYTLKEKDGEWIVVTREFKWLS